MKPSIWTRGAYSIQRIHGLPTPCYRCGQSYYPPTKFDSDGLPLDFQTVPLPLYEIKDSYGRLVLCKICVRASVAVLRLPEPVRALGGKPYVPDSARRSRLPREVGEALSQMTKEEISTLLKRMSTRGQANKS